MECQTSAGADTVRAREQLVQEHMPLVHHLAGRLLRGLPPHIDGDDLVSAGVVGLIDALENFDATRGFSFSTFAVPRIRGAMYDELRRQDDVPRSARRKRRQLAGARAELSRSLARAPRPQEVAAALGIDQRALWRWELDAHRIHPLSLDGGPAGYTDGEGGGGGGLEVGDESSLPVDEKIARDEEVAALHGALEGLKKQERMVLTLYYHKELKMHEIAEVLGVTESRVSQIRSAALKELRRRMRRLRERVA